jgi:uncharacterized lipoprotein YmbA
MSCVGGPAPKQYLLEPVYDVANESIAPAISAIALAEVSVPSYAKDDRLASRSKDFEIEYDTKSQWAESPQDALTRVLANRLRYYLESNVVVEPWPRGYEPEARVEVQFDKILREETGGAELAGQIRIISGDGRSMLDVRTFQLVRYANNLNPNAYFAAVSAGVNDISRMIADSLRPHFKP